MADTELVVRFHRSLYLPSAVKSAVEQYAGLCTSAEVAEDATETVVTLRGYDARYGEAFGDAFANHALFESIVQTRQSLSGGVA